MPNTIGAPTDVANVWIVEDTRDYRETVQELIEAEDDLFCPHAFESAEEVLEALREHYAPEVLLVDIGLPGMSGIDLVETARPLSQGTQMVMLTISEDNDQIFRAICAGACGYLLKTATPDDIIQAVREAHQGGAPMTPQVARRVLNLFTQFHAPPGQSDLTEREMDVLRAMIEGGTKAEIGKRLFIAPATVDTHMRSIYSKLHVHSRTEAVVKALRGRLV